MHRKHITIGIDEVGRGALAGPVMVGAVASLHISVSQVQELFLHNQPKDSKKSSQKQREKVSNFVKEHCLYGLGVVSAAEIDKIGISAALRFAATEAIRQIVAKLPEDSSISIEADASLYHLEEEKYQTRRTIRGDETITVILLASHYAKVARDGFMRTLPQANTYGWNTNVGYGTRKHIAALKTHGMSDQHRRSFCKKVALH